MNTIRKKTFAECVIVDVYPGGKQVAVEYSPEDHSTVNTTLCILTTSPAFKFSADDFNENEATILKYETRSEYLCNFIAVCSYTNWRIDNPCVKSS